MAWTLIVNSKRRNWGACAMTWGKWIPDVAVVGDGSRRGAYNNLT